jgi:hypothetical protein
LSSCCLKRGGRVRRATGAQHHVLDRIQVQVLVGNLELGKVPAGKKKNQLIEKGCESMVQFNLDIGPHPILRKNKKKNVLLLFILVLTLS